MQADNKRHLLCVDDEQNVLDGLRRTLRRQFTVTAANGPEAALEAIASQGPFEVILTDLRMPRLDGLELLERIHSANKTTVGVLLTGNADLEAAIDALNRGNVFRFLRKPCAPNTLVTVLDAAFEQYRLRVAEIDVLERTLQGVVAVLTEVLSLVSPTAFGRASRVQNFVDRIMGARGVRPVWQIRLAAMLSQLGCVALPETLLQKAFSGAALTQTESENYSAHTKIAHSLLANIPRLEQVAEVVRSLAPASSGDTLVNASDDPVVVQGTAILRTAIEFDQLLTQGHGAAEAAERLAQSPAHRRSDLAALARMAAQQASAVVRAMRLEDLAAGMVLEDDVRTVHEVVVVSRGRVITESLLERLKRFAGGIGVIEPIRVRVREGGESPV